MPEFDQREYNLRWKKENQLAVNFKASRRSGEAQALQEACAYFGMKPYQYVRQAVLQKLIADGFNPSDYRPGKEVMQNSDEPIPEIDDPVYAGLLRDQDGDFR